ncbi:DUF441 domain-containing protein [Salirhabdus salicampi]|uniref:DUF441 domain-containing protein n=1 Tax=Salirhabdus salicampi TaxID=476102 RepID=UPI0020C4C1AF|nr:DUF441 domain-containing protein [Salirhabdus salicampi]MCP8617096.1 DUF441 domain-containing protein [Salirhabdus salicampi]
MFSQSTLFLLILFMLGYIAKNNAIMIAIYILLGIKLFQLEGKFLPYIEAKGIGIGVIVITIAVLAPIASGDIGFQQLYESITSYYAWISLAAGMFVAYVAKDGLFLLENSPHLTTALVLGTILAVVFFKGVPVGPLIGAGIAYIGMKLSDYVIQWF